MVFMNVSLTPELANYINDKVASGLYNSSIEVIGEGLRLLKDQDAIRETRLNQLRSQIQNGIDSGESSPLDVEDIIERGRNRHGNKTNNAALDIAQR
jgi:antitoxin ParD1/3/4